MQEQMMTPPRLSALTLAAAIVFAATAGAQELNEAHLAMLDQDGDGAVSKAEYEAYTGAAFTALDTDEDGAISAEEFARSLPPDRMAEMDADGDGTVSQDEYSARTLADFNTADADANAALN